MKKAIDPESKALINETVNKAVSKRIKSNTYQVGSLNQKTKEEVESDKAESLSLWQRQLMEQTGSSYLIDDIQTDPKQLKAVLELPIYGEGAVLKRRAVIGVNSQQQIGMFYQPAIFCDAILSDPVIYSNMQVRVKALTGCPIEFSPADDSDMAHTICEDIEINFSKMVSNNEIEERLRWGLLIGQSISQIYWDTSGDKWIPISKTFNPRNLYYDWGTREYYLNTQSDANIAILAEDIQWDMFFPYGDHLPWKRAMVLALGELWLERNCNEQWWNRAEERMGSPIIQMITSAEANPSEERLFINQLNTVGSFGVIRTPQGEEGNKFDIKLLQPAADLYMGFKELLDYLDRRIAMVILGQDKTTMSKSSGIQLGGDSAGENVRNDLMRSDGDAISSNLREKLFKLYIKFNYGEEFMDLAPYMCFDMESPADLRVRTTELFTASQALLNYLQMPMANEINFTELLKQLRIPLLQKGEPAQQEQQMDQAPELGKSDSQLPPKEKQKDGKKR